MTLKRLIFIRPGETDWNLTGRWQGWVQSPLNELGRQQIGRLSMFIRHIGLSALYSSDNRRARESAEIIATQLPFEPIYDKRLRERSIGYFQGLTVPEIHGWYPDEYRKLLADPEGYKIPAGESLNEVKERAGAALDDIIASAKKGSEVETIAILSHTTTLRTMIKKLLPDTDLTNIAFANSSVTTLGFNDGEWQLNATNDVMHLEGLETRHMPADPRGDDAT